ncbi:hypothetical protein LY78DRAFT_651818 [Colletotrichum sublineola]|nr:hypothetical protein LY78DRAFT_651818 [Colletotrichum sublineola]
MGLIYYSHGQRGRQRFANPSAAAWLGAALGRASSLALVESDAVRQGWGAISEGGSRWGWEAARGELRAGQDRAE